MTSVITPNTRTAIVLFNLGGPDNLDAVKPFLFNLFNDPAIIGAPNPIRYLLAKWISGRRAPVAQGIYKEIGGKSPIVEETEKQQAALEVALQPHGQVKVFTCMRYWHPMSDAVAKQVKAYNPDHVILLPLYPQFSTTTSGSSFGDWKRAAKQAGLTAPYSTICCYPWQDDFIDAHVDRIREKKIGGASRLLFSAHGLPEKIIAKGDPYQWQVEQTVAKVVSRLGIEELDYVTCYQSRVGPLAWIGPSTEDEIKRASADGKDIILIPIAFVSEHSETLVELDIEYRELAEHHGVTSYHRVPALGAHPSYIQGLTRLCLTVDKKTALCSHQGGRICPSRFTQCPHAQEVA